MWTLLLGVIFGLLASFKTTSVPVTVRSRSCSYAGVFHVEGKDRYSLTLDMAKELCSDLGADIASEEEVRTAHSKGLQTCRYGWISNGTVIISRQNAHINCATNRTGVFTNTESADRLFDAMCFNESDVFTVKNCDRLVNPPASQTEDTDASDIPHNGNATVQPVTEVFQYTTSGLLDEGTDSLVEASSTYTITEEPVGPLNATEWSDTDIPGEPTDETVYTDYLAKDDTEHGRMTISHTETTSIAPPIEKRTEPQDPSTDKKTEANRPPGGRNNSRTPLWLIIVAVVVGVCSIMVVCAALSKKWSWCGQTQTLTITKEDAGDGNGVAPVASFRAQEREQEMVTLMNKEQIQENGKTAEEFTVVTLDESPQK
ncbi:hypothetical protein DPEC_G00165090 [Dallia pectoralis]|uniref:Uncharacterized protein n=1 Tax=Dallia pectoralis TaxID=75939 RepID=A0ACC2GHF9_DALPE|nr:hypothetical protein DPEC_G00165090 [Dallia pectoralis]